MAEWVELGALYVDSVVDDATPTTPVLINRNPEPNETDVDSGTLIYLEATDVGGSGIKVVNCLVWVDGSLAFDGNAIQPGFDGAGASWSYAAPTLFLTLDPTADYASLQIVSVRAYIETGNTDILDTTYTFEVEDLTAPQLVGVEARDQFTVRLSFDEPVRQEGDGGDGDGLDPGQYTFEALNSSIDPAVPIEAVSVDTHTPSSVTVTVDTEMSPGITYRVTVDSVEDVWGNPISEAARSLTFVGFRPPIPAGRNWDLWQKIPAINRRQDKTQDLRRFIACLQEVNDLLLYDVDEWWQILDLDLAPEAFVDAMLYDLGNPFQFALTLTQKRKLLRILIEIYKLKGTAIGITNVVRFFVGIEITLIDAYNETTMSLGESELGVDWYLGIDSSFARYSFDVYVDRVLTEEQRRQIREIVEYMKPAHTHFIRLIEPGDPEHIDHWSLGESELEVNTLLHE